MQDIISNLLYLYIDVKTTQQLRLLNTTIKKNVDRQLTKKYKDILYVKDKGEKTFKDYVEEFCNNLEFDSIFVKIQYMNKTIKKMMMEDSYFANGCSDYEYLEGFDLEKKQANIVAQMIFNECKIVKLWKELKELKNILNQNIYDFKEWCIYMSTEESEENVMYYISNNYYYDYDNDWSSIIEPEILLYKYKYINIY
uniref:Uncharacterized protein n=1 Tax=Pithovirus LCDPAC02 TaxID=2506601 RepID=A0A481YPC0_9VIRU|nr:MAG: hypothetical protein LCDPAC02_02970 [Pithovirus LCDPAC02]